MEYLIKSEHLDRIRKYSKGMLLKMGIREVPIIEYSDEPNITIANPIIHKQADDETHMMYRGYMMLHLSSDKDEDIEAVCYSIEIMEAMEREGYPIWEKGIYQGAFQKYK